MNETEIKLQETISNYKKFKKRITIALVFSSLGMGAIGFSIGARVNKQKIPEELEELIGVYTYLKDNFYQEVDTRTIIDGMYYGMTGSFDETYTYYTSTANGEIQNYSTTGSGLGVSRVPYYGNCLIKKVMSDSPAQRAGLKDGDIIFAVQEEGGNKVYLNKISYSSWGLYLSGEEGSKVKVFYTRDGIEYETEITRGSFTQDAVYVNDVINTPGKCEVYITISTFLGDKASTGDLLYSILSKYEEIDHLVIDLRDNGGGYVNYCVDALGVFLPKDSVALVYNKKDGKQEKLRTSRSDQIKVKNNNIDLLINDETASASESFVMGLVDSPKMEGVEVYGQTSYGKGVAQALLDVNVKDEYPGTIRYTFAYTSTEKGTTINRIGIEPDHECGYIPSNQDVYRHYVRGVDNNSNLSSKDKELIVKKINVVLNSNYSSFDEALAAYQTYFNTISNTKIFDEQTASHLQEKMYSLFESGSSTPYVVERSLYYGYVQGKDDNDLFSSQQRLIVKKQINTLLKQKGVITEDYTYFDNAVKAFQNEYGLVDKNGVFDKETADLLQGLMFDLGVLQDDKVLEETQYGK